MSASVVPQIFGIPLKYLSLVVLTVQNSMLVLVMRYSRLVSTTQYHSSTAVLMSELTKFLVCLYITATTVTEQDTVFSWSQIYKEILGDDSWKMLIPAALYTIQNNLQYIAVSILDAATFQVSYQLKILATALCAVVLLDTQLNRTRWISLVVLTIGVILVQLPTENQQLEQKSSNQSIDSVQFLGLLAVFVACILSGLTGVYFEKVLKGTRKSIWVRNVQLSLFSFPSALLGIIIMDGSSVHRDGFFYGYTWWTIAAIACQAVGGLIVAVVVKYADNILKGFATSISIILSCLASVWLFGFQISPMFTVGTFLVIYATYTYGRAEDCPSEPIPLPIATTGDDQADNKIHRK